MHLSGLSCFWLGFTKNSARFGARREGNSHVGMRMHLFEIKPPWPFCTVTLHAAKGSGANTGNPNMERLQCHKLVV